MDPARGHQTEVTGHDPLRTGHSSPDFTVWVSDPGTEAQTDLDGEFKARIPRCVLTTEPDPELRWVQCRVPRRGSNQSSDGIPIKA